MLWPARASSRASSLILGLSSYFFASPWKWHTSKIFSSASCVTSSSPLALAWLPLSHCQLSPDLHIVVQQLSHLIFWSTTRAFLSLLPDDISVTLAWTSDSQDTWMYYQFRVHGGTVCKKSFCVNAKVAGMVSSPQMFDPWLNAPPLKIHWSNHGQTGSAGCIRLKTSDASSVIRVRELTGEKYVRRGRWFRRTLNWRNWATFHKTTLTKLAASLTQE